MPRRDDEYDDDLDRPARRRRPRDDEDDEDDEDLPPPRKKKGSLWLVLGVVGGLLLLCCGGGLFGVWYGCDSFRQGFREGFNKSADRTAAANDLKQIGLACHNYNDRLGTFPTNSHAPNGQPLLSWRVHILPFLGQEALYRQFNLNEPWDGPTNRRLLDQMPAVYATPAERAGRAVMGNKTYYRGFSSPGALFERPPGPAGAFQPGRGVSFAQVTDGLSNTIMAVEAGTAVEWTKPDDLDAGPGKPFPALGGARPRDDMVMVLFADLSVRSVRRTTPESTWRAAVTYAGNEIVTFD